MLRHVVVIALVACSTHHDAPPPPKLPVLPDSITNQLGNVGLALAIDLRGLDAANLAALAPADPPCMRMILQSARLGAVTQSGATWQGYVAGVDPAATRACVTAFASRAGLTVKDHGTGFELDLATTPVVFQWQGDLALITEGKEPPHAGEPSGVMFDLLAKVPRTAKGWFASIGIPAYKMRDIVAWLDLAADSFQITLQFESMTRDEAGVEAARVVEAFKEAARGNGVAVEDGWFDIKSTPTSAIVTAKLPIAAFAVK
ncbi:MAG TPA: hypothetical protein VFQ65_17480 [Kofleriaceae bacterium]|nr:hypothetical protein [Kofleriaceae bacterium]